MTHAYILGLLTVSLLLSNNEMNLIMMVNWRIYSGLFLNY